MKTRFRPLALVLLSLTGWLAGPARADTLFGVTYVCVAPEHPLVSALTAAGREKAVSDYIAAAASKSDMERTDATKTRAGVDTGSFATHPVTGARLPVWVADYVIGGYGGVHQFCRIGAHAMLSATAKLVHDLPPYFIADGTPAVVRAYNKVGMERRGFTAEQLERVKMIFRVLYRDGLNRTQALEKLNTHAQAGSAEFQAILKFAAASERGLAPGVN
jgi:hypothetical protein